MNVLLLVTLIAWLVLGPSASTGLKKVSLKDYNPGVCNKLNRGNLAIVKDGKNNDKLLVCLEENNVYLWKTTDDSKTTGEFFNPAHDCSDVLSKISDAKDGYYWIKLPGNVPVKLWCDLTTDGGGWALIGRTAGSATWKVPSNNKTFEPLGKPHWSSSLGDAPILDFRVQVATGEDFKTTKADWSYRLLKERPLKKLLMLNEGGCGRLSAGIGNVSYVKDLQTETIVATKFRCSNFSSYHSTSDTHGWDMLNTCFKRPCSPGKNDSSGAFSYSASNATGINDFTSFVGCDSNKCCGCFGPVGGRKNYCGTGCTAKNGGTILNNMYTWFWVRSSMPKRISNKYKVLSDAVDQIKPQLEQMEAKITLQQNYFNQLRKSLHEMKSQLASLNKTDISASGGRIPTGENCADLYRSGLRRDGVYTITPSDGLGAFQVTCDMTTDGGGWTLLQRREDSTGNFDQPWQAYKDGFGDLSGNFWLGLDKIHRLTKLEPNILRVDLTNRQGLKAYAKYGSFSVESESAFYKMKCDKYSGTAGDSLKYHNGAKFTTKDRDNDPEINFNCGSNQRGGWWYMRCHRVNLNGIYSQTAGYNGIHWFLWRGLECLTKTAMKIRPAQFQPNST